MAILRVSDINKTESVSSANPKVIDIALGEEGKISELDHYKADLSDDEYETIKWILSDVENVKAVLTSAKRRRAKLGKPKAKKGE